MFVRDRVAGTTERVSVTREGAQANGDSELGGISGDGRYVAFGSRASNVVAGAQGAPDVFVRDRVAQTTTLISVGRDWTPRAGRLRLSPGRHGRASN